MLEYQTLYGVHAQRTIQCPFRLPCNFPKPGEPGGGDDPLKVPDRESDPIGYYQHKASYGLAPCDSSPLRVYTERNFIRPDGYVQRAGNAAAVAVIYTIPESFDKIKEWIKKFPDRAKKLRV